MNRQPLIAITPDFSRKDDGRISSVVHREYTEAIIAAGGLPMVLPFTDHKPTLDALLARADGLLLTGGGDVDPALYGRAVSEPLKSTLKSVNAIRDTLEIFLAQRLLRERHRPLLGICRGCQVLNVAAAGTLVVDLPSEVGTAVNHAVPRPFEPAHDVTVTPGSRLATIVGATTIAVNSSHHQAVKALAPEFRCVAQSPGDGVVEAIELPDAPFVLGVQWHPERLQEKHRHAAALFRAFVEQAAGR